MKPLHYPNPSIRHAVYAANGMVATSQHLAAQAGLDIIKQGGNAIDAAVATAACLTVVEPTSNGIGGDAFALVWSKGKLHALNGSGSAPKNITIDAVKAAGHKTMPIFGVFPITTPGAVGVWAELLKELGTFTLPQCLAPAIEYAQRGYPLSPALGNGWGRAFARFKDIFKGEQYENWFTTFAPDGKAPGIGEIWNSPDHAKTLQEIGETNGESFYRGSLAEKMADFVQKHGGYLTKEDLAGYSPEWVQPISINYKGYDIWEMPPNGQGVVALLALGAMRDFPYENSIKYLHKQIEAMKLSFATGKATITDSKFMKYSCQELLNPEFLKEIAAAIEPVATMPKELTPNKGGTVYLTTADGQGNMVSFIQSNYMGFGCGLVVPGTGISIQNRGCDFSLDPHHINALAGGKRTYHTIIPGFITKDDSPVASFGVMGGYMQPQGHLQVVSGLIDQELNPQAALDAPRWRWVSDNHIEVEHSFPKSTAKELVALGHRVTVALDSTDFGRGQIIMRSNNGTLVGGCEPRTDSAVACW
ncbi:MAG: gamma-glutamyltransferase family protein [Defluviitaleaceae bacterium]|nr:gamma-glutamyltransferase family protein [Defluviitaleaceae bacterium]